jgi:hypothetical protein
MGLRRCLERRLGRMQELFEDCVRVILFWLKDQSPEDADTLAEPELRHELAEHLQAATWLSRVIREGRDSITDGQEPLD